MQSGFTFCYTDNIELAAALTALDIQLVDDIDSKGKKSCPYFYHIRNGEEKCVWNFKTVSESGEFRTQDLIEAYGKGDKWFAENPTHPFTYAVHAQRNLATYQAWLDQDMPFASFDIGSDRTLHVKVWTEDYQKAIAGGLKPL